MSQPTWIRAPLLEATEIDHVFFTRRGGVSTGVYASLNGGVGSRDAPEAVAENRERMAHALAVAPDYLLTPYQIHSADALIVETPWPASGRPRCDALITRVPGLALGVTGADCGMVLLHDRAHGVIGAAHAGWKGALAGILESSVASMERLGARRSDICAVLGPTIARGSYEVGPEFVARFRAADPANAGFFTAQARSDRAFFDLPAYIADRLGRAGVGDFVDLALDTYADEERFFSYRRTQHRGEADYGRLVAAIVLH